MNTKLLGLVVVATLAVGTLAACSNLTGPGESKDAEKQVYGPIVLPADPDLEFDFDETASAASTLAQYPSVVTWRLKLHSQISAQNVRNQRYKKLAIDAQIWGWDASGNQIASGTVHVQDPNNFGTWYSNVVVAGASIDLETAGPLLEGIMSDIDAELGVGKVPCWILKLAAGGAVVAACAAALATVPVCVGTVLAGCPAALLAAAAADVVAVAAILAWECECLETNNPLCDE